MGTREGNRLVSHVQADSISVDSLSFAGLVCIEDQQPKPSVPNKYYRVSKTDPDFEFSTNKSDSNSSTNNPIKITPADVLISNGKIKPQELATFQPNSPSSLSTLLGIDHHVKSNMSNGPIHSKAIKNANKEKSATRTSFGKKVCNSFLSPCRQCKAIQPRAVKAQTTVPGEKSKLLT